MMGQGANLLKKHLKTIFRTVVLIACGIYLTYFFLDNKDTLDLVFHLNPVLLLIILMLQPIFYLLQSWRYKIIIEKCSLKKLPFRQTFKIYILSRFLNTLFSQTGNVYTGVRLKKDFDITYTRFISGHVSLTWLDLVMNLLLAVTLILLIHPTFRFGAFSAWQLLSLLAALLLVIPFFVFFVIRQMAFRNRFLVWTHSKLTEVASTLVTICKDPIFLSKIFCLGLLLFVRTCIAFSLYFLCLGVPINLAAIAVFYVLFKLSSFIVLTPGNLGVQEVVWGFLSEQMGIGMAQGVLVSALVRLFGTFTIFALGFAFGGADLLRHRHDYKPADETRQDNGV